MSAVLFVTGESLGDLLKAGHYENKWINGHMRAGSWVHPHNKMVLVSDDHDDVKVAAGQGSFYQKQAHKLAHTEVDNFAALPVADKAAIILSHATTLQKEASASAAVSGFKASMLAGKAPTPAQYKAMQDASSDTQANVANTCAAVIGDEKYEKLLMAASANAKAKGETAPVPTAPAAQASPVKTITAPAETGHVDPVAKPLHTFTGDGLESYVTHGHGKMKGQFGVSLKDTDAGEFVPSVTFYPAEADAIASAKAAAGVKDDPWAVENLHEGDTKVEYGKTYVLQGGRWHLQGGDDHANVLLTGVHAAQVIAEHKADPSVLGYSMAELKAAWLDANPGKVGAQAEWVIAADAAAKPVSADPAVFGPTVDTPVPGNIKAVIDKISSVPTGDVAGAKTLLQEIVKNNAHNPHIQAYASASLVQAGLNAAKPTKAAAPPVVTVSVPPGGLDPAAAVAAMENGAYYQKEAIKKLKAEHGDAWASMHPKHQHELAQAKYKELQGAASQAAAVSGWKKSLLAGKPPTPSELLAVANMAKDGPPGKVAKLVNEVSKVIGPDKFLALITQGNAKLAQAKAKAAVSASNPPPPSAAGSSQAINAGAPSAAAPVPGDQPLTPIGPVAPAAPQTVNVKASATVLHNIQPGHNKSWSASLSPDGLSMMTQYGKIGAKQQTTIKTFATPSLAAAAINKLIKAKKDAGYSYQTNVDHEWTVPVQTFTPAAPAPAGPKASPKAEAGPKNGDTKQGADGLLYFKDGRWHKMGLSEDAVMAAAKTKYANWTIGNHGVVPGLFAQVKAAAIAGDLAAAEAALNKLTTGYNAPKTKAKSKAIIAALKQHQKDVTGKKVLPKPPPAPAAPAAPAAKVKALTQFEVDSCVKASASKQSYMTNAKNAALAGDEQGMKTAWIEFENHKAAAQKTLPLTTASIKALAAAMGVVLPGVVPAQPAAASAAAAPAAAPTPKSKAPPLIKVGGVSASPIDAWPQTGPQKGSNPGGKFKDKQGVEWYCKFPADKNVALNELLAAKFYQMLGVNVPALKLVSQKGKIGIASKWVDGMSKGTAAQLAKAKGAHESFAIDAWLANWDVVGLSNDNLMLGKDGAAVHVDVGGSLVYRAQGGEKGTDFGDTVPELETLKDPKKNDKSAAVFAGVTPESMEIGLRQLNKLKPSQITELCEKLGPGSTAEKAALAAKLIARRAYILKKFGIQDQWAVVHKLDPSNLPVNPADLPAPIQFTASSKPHVNSQNTKDSEALIAFASKGNLTALKDYQYDAVDKETSAPLGKKSILDHPSKPLKEQWAGLVELLQSISTPPIPTLAMPSLGAVGDLEEISDFVGSFNPQERVETVAAEHRMHFFMALSHIDDIAGLVADMKWSFLKSGGSFVQAAKAKHKSLSATVIKYISSVQASGAINHSWSQGKTTVQSMGIQKLTEKIYAEAQELPEGTTLIRGMSDTSAGKSMCKQLLSCAPGTVIQNTDSMCASYNENHSWGGDVQMTIRCAKGCKATLSFASGSFNSEHEITTLPGQRYVVLSTKKVHDTVHLEVLMLPPHDGYVAELGKLAALGKALVVIFTRGL